MLYEVTYMWKLKEKKNAQKKRSDLWLPEMTDVGLGCRWSKGTDFQFQDK